ncbi:MAG TPA: ammonia-forming cytochrome c nitrite reductase subunit c552 [Bacillota bacterium]|nr:ammonia-forming cytochrome c nitrite reductase subunit c552 [Bacillota bacterium]
MAGARDKTWIWVPLFLALSTVLIWAGQRAIRPELPEAEAPLSPAAAEFWRARFPDQTAGYLRTLEMQPTEFGGAVPYQKLTAYPFLRDMYRGFGFFFDFRESRGHMFAHEDTMITGRPKAGGVCWACKSADYPALTRQYGRKEFDNLFWSEAAPRATHPVTCIDCHDAESPAFGLTLTRPWVAEALAAAGRKQEDYSLRGLTCAQCHSEYYFGTDLAVTFPWEKGFRVDEVLARYDQLGFSDWVHPWTGAGLLKVQHPEFEMFQDSPHQRLGLTCADCHLPRVAGEGGREFSSHWLTSPLNHMEASCQRCHGPDLAGLRLRTEAIQGELRAAANAVGRELQAGIILLRDVRARPDSDPGQIARAQRKHREAQFLLDWFIAENSTGFHHPAEARRAIALAREATQAMVDHARMAGSQ